MPPNPERQAKMRAKREEMANDPKLREAMEDASAAVLGAHGGGSEGEVPENLASGAPPAGLEGSETEADKEGKSRSSFGVAPVIAPPLSKPPIGKPMVPSEAPRAAPRAGPRMGVPRSSRPAFSAAPSDAAPPAPLQITPQMRVDTNDPLGVGPKWKYAEGGRVGYQPSSRLKGSGGKEMIAGALSDYLGDRLKRRYAEEAVKKMPSPPTEDPPLPQFKSGGSVSFAKGGGSDYGKDYRKGK